MPRTCFPTVTKLLFAALTLVYSPLVTANAAPSITPSPSATEQPKAESSPTPTASQQPSPAASPQPTPAAASTPDEDETPTEDSKNTDAELAGEKPELTFTKTRHEFGELYRGQKASFSFKFRNTGKAPLEIRSIHSACGCINTRVEPRPRFLPSEEGSVAFEFDSTWFSGGVTKTITVDSNDPAQPTTILTVGARVREEIRATPAIISMGEISKETSKNFALTIDLVEKARGIDVPPSQFSLARIPPEMESIKKAITTPSPTLKVLGITSSSKFLTVDYTPQSGDRQQIQIKLKGPLPSGPFRERISIWNTSTFQKEFVVPVIGEVVGHLRPSTRYLEFGVVKVGKKSRRTLTLNSDEESFKVESVAIDLRKFDALKKFDGTDFIVATIDKGPRGSVLNFELRVPQGLEFSSSSINISGTVLVRTNDKDLKDLRVPFFGVLQQEEEP